MTISCKRSLLALFLSLLGTVAHAGAIYFNLAVVNGRLEVSNLGNSSAFYAAAFRLSDDGRWEALQPLPRQAHAAELPGNARIEFFWPAYPGSENPRSPAFAQPVMIRFFDQAGAGFGQISFFRQPAAVSEPVESFYHDGQMILVPPPSSRNAWLLWAQEEGIAPLQQAVEFVHRQPAAQRISWHAGDRPKAFDLGRGQPAAMLLHETPQGLELQVLASGGRQGREQRAAWLDATPSLNWLAGAALVAAAGLLAWQWAASRRTGRA